MLNRSYLDNLDRDIEEREAHRSTIGYVRVTKPLCEYLASFGPWVEINAGTGALAQGIREAGGRCVATDLHDWGYFDRGQWSTSGTIKADAVRVARLVARRPSLGLLSSWPNYNEPYCFRAVRQLALGQRFAYIGEGDGGCTGDDDLHNLLASDFEQIGEMDINPFWGMHDWLTVYRRVK